MGACWTRFHIRGSISTELRDLISKQAFLQRQINSQSSLTSINEDHLTNQEDRSYAQQKSLVVLKKIESVFAPLPVEIIKKLRYGDEPHTTVISLQDTIVNTLKRRPSTLEDLMITLKVKEEELKDLLHSLMESNMIMQTTGNRGKFYKAKDHSNSKLNGK